MKRTRKLFSILLAAALLLTLAPAASLAATVTAPLDFTGMGDADNLASHGWSWAQSTKTLTLDGFDFNASRPNAPMEPYAAILLPAGATVTLNGSNRIETTDYAHCIEAQGSLTLTGDGELTIVGNRTYGAWSDGIYAPDGSVSVNCAALTINVARWGIWATGVVISDSAVQIGVANTGDLTYGIRASNGNVNISDATVTITSDHYGIYADLGDVTIGGSSFADITAGNEGIRANVGSVTVNDDAAVIIESEGAGIMADRIVTIGGKSMKITADSDGIVASDTLIIAAGTIDITAGHDGLAGPDDLIIIGCSGTIRTTDDSGDYWAVYAWDSIGLGDDITVKGWDGDDYTVDSVIGAFDEDYIVFLDAQTQSIPLTDIQFGPAAREYTLIEVAGVSLSVSDFGFDVANQLITASINVPLGTNSIGVGDIVMKDGADYMAFDYFLPNDFMSNPTYDHAAIIANLGAAFGIGDGAEFIERLVLGFGLDIEDIISFAAGAATDIYIAAGNGDYYKITVNRAAASIPPWDFVSVITDDRSGAGWTWEQSTKTLTLDGADFAYDVEPEGFVILLPDGATVVLAEGSENTVTCMGDGYGILSMGDLTVSGTGSVTITANVGITAGGVTINDCSVTVTSEYDGILAYDGVLLDGSTVTIHVTEGSGVNVQSGSFTLAGGALGVDAGGFGIHVDDGDVTIGGNLTIDAGYAGIYVYEGSVTVGSGTVEIKADEFMGIYARRGDITLNGGTVDIVSGYVGIYSANGKFSLNGGSGTVKTLDTGGDAWAVQVRGEIELGDGLAVKGWDGSAYTVASVVGVLIGETTFLDAQTESIPLLNFQFGPAQTESPFWGDADDNGVVNAADAAAILRFLVQLRDLTPQGKINAKVTLPLTANISAADAAKILRWLVQLVPELDPTK
ncbi:MAG: carbohydrate-binding domain-containing protein [Clostridiales bacterium]|nr:carbohydrate-binding domain-containing protein [Clostridiales bacterium]